MQGYSPPAAATKSRNQHTPKAPEAHRLVTSTRRPHTTGVCCSSVITQALTRIKKRRTVHKRKKVMAKPTHLQCLVKLQPTRRITAASLKVGRPAKGRRLALAEPYRQQHNSHPVRDLIHQKEKHQGGGLLSQVMINATPQACTYLSSPRTNKAVHFPCLNGRSTDRDCKYPLRGI
ncbi:Hypothetical predicted protein, partial [Pelobates cultripes]